MIRYRSWSALFALASLALGALLWLRVSQSDAPPASVGAQAPPTPAAPARGAVYPVRLEKLDSYAAIAERPLFSPTRRPAEPAPDTAPSQPRKSLARFVLSGVIIVSPEEKIALLRESKSPSAQRLSEGDEIAGWRIDKILPDRVILISGDKTAEIELWSDRQPPPRTPQAPQPRGARPQPGAIKLPTPVQPK